MVGVGPGDVEEEEDREVDNVAEQESQQRGEEHQPGQEPARVRAHNLQLGRKLVLEIRI